MIQPRDDNRVVRRLAGPDTDGSGDRVVDRYGVVWRVLPSWQRIRADATTGERLGTLHPDGRITEP